MQPWGALEFLSSGAMGSDLGFSSITLEWIRDGEDQLGGYCKS